jgi:hypothetical protein
MNASTSTSLSVRDLRAQLGEGRLEGVVVDHLEDVAIGEANERGTHRAGLIRVDHLLEHHASGFQITDDESRNGRQWREAATRLARLDLSHPVRQHCVFLVTLTTRLPEPMSPSTTPTPSHASRDPTECATVLRGSLQIGAHRR